MKISRINRLFNEKSGKCFDVASASTANGANVQQWNCSGAQQQKFQVVLNNGARLRPGDVEGSGFALYPNPAKELLYISRSDIAGGDPKMVIYDNAGRTVYAAEWSEKVVSVDLSGFSSGVYVVRIIHNKGVITKKFTKN